MLAGLSFTAPLLLAALIALPALWFLLRAVPQTPREQRFPGLFFLRRLKDTEETPARMPWPLLLLRLFILTLIIIGLAGPVLNATQRSDGTGPLLIVLDNTWLAANDWQDRQTAMQRIAAETENTNRQIWILTTAETSLPQRDTQLSGPYLSNDLVAYAETTTPTPFPADRPAVIRTLETFLTEAEAPVEVRWLSDGYFTGDNIQERQFARTLKKATSVTGYIPQAPLFYLKPVRYQADKLTAQLHAAEPLEAEQQLAVSIISRDGRLLKQADTLMEAGTAQQDIEIDLPLSLRNTIGSVRIANQRSAGAVQLNDASNRRAFVGVADAGDALSGTLLDGRFYLQQALAPYALFDTDTVTNLAASDASVIILDDFGRLRATERAALEDWVQNGGVLIRFAGPTLADAAQDRGFNDSETLIPVPLRGGGRAFGGALTWEEPQPLGGFAESSPFADLTVSSEVRIQRQILALPGAETAENSWAWLQDGTPLVTARAEEEGLIVLFHVTASPSWSDLPVSGLFVEMLRRIVSLSVTSQRELESDMTYPPRQLLSGQGQLVSPAADALPVRAGATAAPASPPGLYGSPDAPLAINTVAPDTTISPLSAIGAFDGTTLRAYGASKPQRLTTLLLLIAFALFLIDCIASLWVQGRLWGRQTTTATTAAIALAACLSLIANTNDALAQPIEQRADLDRQAVEAALETRFAYVLTGDREVDALSAAGLQSLSNRLRQRTALEPAAPTGIDLTSDTLSVYPLLYWPITATTPVPQEFALEKLEAFMAGGGMIVFDTRDGERQLSGGQTPEGIALKNILEQLNIPPLEPLPTGHVLRRSFYLMDDLPGRNNQGPVWVEAQAASGNLNDGVTPVIIGGRDWAAAWATDDGGRPLRPMGAAGFQAREFAYRSGINIAMVALTGNYKLDQLQTQNLLDRLGTERDSQ